MARGKYRIGNLVKILHEDQEETHVIKAFIYDKDGFAYVGEHGKIFREESVLSAYREVKSRAVVNKKSKKKKSMSSNEKARARIAAGETFIEPVGVDQGPL